MEHIPSPAAGDTAGVAELRFDRYPPAPVVGSPLVGALGLCLVALAGVVYGAKLAEALWGWERFGALAGGVIGAAAAAAVYLRCRTPAQVAPIVLAKDHALLPPTARAATARPVPYRDITSIAIVPAPSAKAPANPAVQRLIIGTRRGAMDYPVSGFAGPAAAAELWTALRARIGALPGGDALLADMDRRERDATVAMTRRAPVTETMLGVLMAVFALQYLAVDLDRPLALLRLGANAPALVSDGQWYRLATASFLHGGTWHLFLNLLALSSLGWLVERMVGSWRFSIVYLASAIAGATASWLAHAGTLSVGSSTAVFGLLGALAVLHLRHRDDVPAGFRQTARWWVFILGINAALPFAVPVIDWAGHAGGFAAGALVTWALSRRADAAPDHRAVWTAPGRVVRAVAVGLVAVTVASAGIVAARFFTADAGADADIVITATLRDRGAPAALVNNLGWRCAIDPEASAANLDLARQALESVVAAEPDDPAYADTLATLYYRQGRLDDAVALELKAQRLADKELYGDQLARFLRARVREAGPVIAGGATPDAVQIAVAVPVTVELARAFPRGVVSHWQVTRRGEVVGMLRVTVGGDQPPGEPLVPVSELRTDRLPRGDGIAYQLARVDASGCGCAPHALSVRYWKLDPLTARLP